jgi:Sortase domain
MVKTVRRILLLAALAALVSAAPGLGAEPPNENDPCSRDGRNVCGTTGVGFYDNYRYGVRWFGDFRGAVADVARTFCIDLRFWYPSKGMRFALVEPAQLKNRDGDVVTYERQRRMAYAAWAFGRTNSANQQAAVMLYVHSQMGDAAPGEIDPAALDPAVSAIFERVANDSERLHGPYRVTIGGLPSRMSVGTEATVAIRVLADSGAAVPNVRLALTAKGLAGVPGSIETDDSGVARLELAAADAGELTLSARSEPLASTLPAYYFPRTPVALRNGQRLLAPDSQRVTGASSVTVGKVRIAATTVARPGTVLAGRPARDVVTLTGALPSYRGTVRWAIHGPFRTVNQIACNGEPAARGTFRANGPGAYITDPVRLAEAGIYAYQEVIAGDGDHVGLTTPCNVPSERVRVEVQPRVTTEVSKKRTEPGAPIHDEVRVLGLAGESAAVRAALYGPFAAPDVIKCNGKPVWSETFSVSADGLYETKPVTLETPGFYTFREWIAPTGFVRAATTMCGEVEETTVVVASPQVRTRISDQTTRPGVRITDRVIVEGLGALAVTVKVALFGPFASRSAIRCTGQPYWRGTFSARGDGTYTTQPVEIDRVGYYTYRESIAGSVASKPAVTECADVAETTLATAQPAVTTIVSNDVVGLGSTLFDRIRVSGLGETRVRIGVELFGPFATRADIGCGGTPYWQGVAYARGDGELRSPSVRLAKVGFYAYRERILPAPHVTQTETECALVAETALAAPAINTGRSRGGGVKQVGSPDRRAPTRVAIASLGIDAPVTPTGINVAKGELDAHPNVGRTSWWRDGAAPGASRGTVLIAGHVDSATQGPGAFFRLKDARVGDRITVTSRSGARRTYRVVSVRTMPKAKLPPDVYSTRGRHRLALVTCGGPFIEASGHYRDNVVVIAVPA